MTLDRYDVTPVADVPKGWVVVLSGETPDGMPVVVSHAPHPALRTVAVLDAVLNNSDRKGGHLLRDGEGVRGCDHGVSLGVEPKLRTVLWGWAGEALPDADVARLEALLTRPDTRGAEGERAKGIVEKGRGASERSVALVHGLLDG